MERSGQKQVTKYAPTPSQELFDENVTPCPHFSQQQFLFPVYCHTFLSWTQMTSCHTKAHMAVPVAKSKRAVPGVLAGRRPAAPISIQTHSPPGRACPHSQGDGDPASSGSPSGTDTRPPLHRPGLQETCCALWRGQRSFS